MYRILLTKNKKAYAIECNNEDSDNLFHNYLNEVGVIAIFNDINDFKTYLPDYEVEIVKQNE